MSLFATLAREHRVFTKLIERLERCVRCDDAAACREVRNTLLVLLPALDRHEEIEDRVFGKTSDLKGIPKNVLSQIARQHAALNAIEEDLKRALQSADSGYPGSIKPLVEPLAQRLRAHFWTEENCLWPRYAETSRSVTRSTQRGAAKEVRELEKSVVSHWSAIADYLDQRT